jgi:hypothetical protein
MANSIASGNGSCNQKQTTAANKNLGKKLRFMRLAVAAAGQTYVPHPTTKFQQKEKHNMAMVLMQPQHKQAKHELMRISGKLGLGFYCRVPSSSIFKHEQKLK